MMISKNKVVKSTHPRIGYNCLSAQKERTQLQTIPQSTYNNTLPKPLIQRNMKQHSQIKKNTSLLPKVKLLSVQQTNQNMIIQQTLPTTKQIPPVNENNHNDEMNKTVVSITPLFIHHTEQQTRRGIINHGEQHQSKKQVQKSANQQQNVETLWRKQKQSLLSTITNLAQKLQSIQAENTNLRTLLYPKHSPSSSPTSSISLPSLQFPNQTSPILHQQHYSQMSTQLVSRILGKVQTLQSELNFFINLSCELKEKKGVEGLEELCGRLERCEEALRVSQEKVSFYQTQFQKNNHPLSNQQLQTSKSQHQQTLQSQLANYQLQYDQLKKQNFLLQQQYRNFTLISNRKQQSLQQQYSELMEKYHQLYQSYRRLYYGEDRGEEGRSYESSSGFINEVNESIELDKKSGERSLMVKTGERSLQLMRDVTTTDGQHRKRPSQHLLYYHSNDNTNCNVKYMKASCQQLFHCNSSQFPDCEDISHPIESPDQCKHDLESTQPTRIILSELIRQTLEIAQ